MESDDGILLALVACIFSVFIGFILSEYGMRDNYGAKQALQGPSLSSDGPTESAPEASGNSPTPAQSPTRRRGSPRIKSSGESSPLRFEVDQEIIQRSPQGGNAGGTPSRGPGAFIETPRSIKKGNLGLKSETQPFAELYIPIIEKELREAKEKLHALQTDFQGQVKRDVEGKLKRDADGIKREFELAANYEAEKAKTSALQEELSNEKRANNTLRDRLDHMRRRTDSQMEQLRQSSNEKALYAAQLKESELTLNAVKCERNSLTEENKSLVQQLEVRRLEFETSQQGLAGSHKEIRSLKRENEELSEVHEALKSKSESTAETLEQQKSNFQILKDESIQHQAEIEKGRTEKNRAEVKCKELDEKKAILQKDLEKVIQENEQAGKEQANHIRSLTHQKAQVEEDNKKLRVDKERLESQCQDDQRKTLVTQEENECLQKRIDDIEKRYQTIQETNSSLQQHIHVLEERLKDYPQSLDSETSGKESPAKGISEMDAEGGSELLGAFEDLKSDEYKGKEVAPKDLESQEASQKLLEINGPLGSFVDVHQSEPLEGQEEQEEARTEKSWSEFSENNVETENETQKHVYEAKGQASDGACESRTARPKAESEEESISEVSKDDEDVTPTKESKSQDATSVDSEDLPSTSAGSSKTVDFNVDNIQEGDSPKGTDDEAAPTVATEFLDDLDKDDQKVNETDEIDEVDEKLERKSLGSIDGDATEEGASAGTSDAETIAATNTRDNNQKEARQDISSDLKPLEEHLERRPSESKVTSLEDGNLPERSSKLKEIDEEYLEKDSGEKSQDEADDAPAERTEDGLDTSKAEV